MSQGNEMASRLVAKAGQTTTVSALFGGVPSVHGLSPGWYPLLMTHPHQSGAWRVTRTELLTILTAR